MGVIFTSPADLCQHCGKMRKFHERRTLKCPVGKMHLGGYVTFSEDTFLKKLPESAIDKYRIAVDQIYLAADGSNDGYVVKDVHKNPAGDYLTVQRVTPQGKDGPLTRVDAYEMTQKTHYEAERPPWWPKTMARSKR